MNSILYQSFDGPSSSRSIVKWIVRAWESAAPDVAETADEAEWMDEAGEEAAVREAPGEARLLPRRSCGGPTGTVRSVSMKPWMRRFKCVCDGLKDVVERGRAVRGAGKGPFLSSGGVAEEGF